MGTAIATPAGLALLFALVGTLVAAIIPTCLYLYVEPRGRPQWRESASPLPNPDTEEVRLLSRRAPLLVRVTAWLSFAVGQWAIPGLLVPAGCALLVYLQLKLGVARPVGLAVTAVVALTAIGESLLASSLLPLGVRLLTRDARLHPKIGVQARRNAIASVAVLGASGGLVRAMNVFPGLLHPWLRGALSWTALRPVMAYAVACLLHAVLLGMCARAWPRSEWAGARGEDR